MRYYQIHRVTHARDVGFQAGFGHRTFWGGSGAGSGWFRDGSGMVPDSYKDFGAGFGVVPEVRRAGGMGRPFRG